MVPAKEHMCMSMGCGTQSSKKSGHTRPWQNVYGCVVATAIRERGVRKLAGFSRWMGRMEHDMGENGMRITGNKQKLEAARMRCTALAKKYVVVV